MVTLICDGDIEQERKDGDGVKEGKCEEFGLCQRSWKVLEV